MPKVSVIMPSLNVAPYIRACMDSVLAQTLKDIEILCVDAGSTDGTLEILREYERRDSRVRVLQSDKKSYGYQMNLGMDAATGEYMGIVETDDLVAPEMFERLYRTAVKHRLDVLKCDCTLFFGEGEQRRTLHGRTGWTPRMYGRDFDPSTDHSVFRNAVNTWAGLYRLDFLRREGIRHHESPGASYQDSGLWFQVFTLAKRVRFVPHSYYLLRRDNQGSSVFSTSKVFCICDEYDFIRDFLRRRPELEREYAPLCAFCRFRFYLWNLHRLPREQQQAFLPRFQADFQKIEADGELDPSLYRPREWRTLRGIMAGPAAWEKMERSGLLSGKAPNKLLSGLWCVRDHGLRYTVKYHLTMRGQYSGA